MKLKSLFVLSGFILVALLSFHTLSSQAQSAEPTCKCKQSGNTEPCTCGDSCRCLPVENPCKCGTACGCKKSGDTSQCKCGANCQCHPSGTMDGMSMSHNHSASQNSFLQIMDRMMLKMDSIPLTASVEYNFLVQMMPHHQAAIDMARYEISNGSDPQMIQLAKSILAEQQGEIQDMQAMLQNYTSVKGVVSPNYQSAMNQTMTVMMQNTPVASQLHARVDCAFAQVMLPHHQAAIDMAVAILRFNPRKEVAIYARRIIGDQQVEIDQMNEYLTNNCKQ